MRRTSYKEPSVLGRASEDTGGDVRNGEGATSSTNTPGTAEGRNTREDPVPREENLTAEDWAVMDAVERCPVWRAHKAFNSHQREKLLAAMCLVIQESVEGNEERTAIHGVEEFRDGGRRWGKTNQRLSYSSSTSGTICCVMLLELQQQWRVWEPSAASSGGGCQRRALSPGEHFGRGAGYCRRRWPNVWRRSSLRTPPSPLEGNCYQTEQKLRLTDATRRKENKQIVMSEGFSTSGESFHQCKQ